MKTFKRFITMLLAVTFILSACAPAALASFKARTNTSAKAYSVPSVSGKSVRVPKGLTVTVTAYSGNWARVSYKGKTAYVPLSNLNLVNRVTAYTAKSTPVYRSASTSSKMGTLSIATKVYVVGKSGSYYRVQNSSGSMTGYVKSGYLTSKAKLTAAYNAYKKAKAAAAKKKTPAKKTPTAKKTSSGSSSSSKLVSYMKTFLGKPYAANSNPPHSFNCSTFVNYVMAHFGISTKRTAALQASDNRFTKVTSISSLKVGDILCFDGDDDGVCDHTGIYIGGNSFIEASRNAGKVHTNTINSWYRSHFMWARRP